MRDSPEVALIQHATQKGFNANSVKQLTEAQESLKSRIDTNERELEDIVNEAKSSMADHECGDQFVGAVQTKIGEMQAMLSNNKPPLEDLSQAFFDLDEAFQALRLKRALVGASGRGEEMCQAWFASVEGSTPRMQSQIANLDLSARIKEVSEASRRLLAEPLLKQFETRQAGQDVSLEIEVLCQLLPIGRVWNLFVKRRQKLSVLQSKPWVKCVADLEKLGNDIIVVLQEDLPVLSANFFGQDDFHSTRNLLRHLYLDSFVLQCKYLVQSYLAGNKSNVLRHLTHLLTVHEDTSIKFHSLVLGLVRLDELPLMPTREILCDRLGAVQAMATGLLKEPVLHAMEDDIKTNHQASVIRKSSPPELRQRVTSPSNGRRGSRKLKTNKKEKKEKRKAFLEWPEAVLPKCLSSEYAKTMTYSSRVLLDQVIRLIPFFSSSDLPEINNCICEELDVQVRAYLEHLSSLTNLSPSSRPISYLYLAYNTYVVLKGSLAALTAVLVNTSAHLGPESKTAINEDENSKEISRRMGVMDNLLRLLDQKIFKTAERIISIHTRRIRDFILPSMPQYEWEKQRDLPDFLMPKVNRCSGSLCMLHSYIRRLPSDLLPQLPLVAAAHIVTRVVENSAVAVVALFKTIEPSRFHTRNWKVDLVCSVRLLRSLSLMMAAIPHPPQARGGDSDKVMDVASMLKKTQGQVDQASAELVLQFWLTFAPSTMVQALLEKLSPLADPSGEPSGERGERGGPEALGQLGAVVPELWSFAVDLGDGPVASFFSLVGYNADDIQGSAAQNSLTIQGLELQWDDVAPFVSLLLNPEQISLYTSKRFNLREGDYPELEGQDEEEATSLREALASFTAGRES